MGKNGKKFQKSPETQGFGPAEAILKADAVLVTFTEFLIQLNNIALKASNVGSVVECSPATRAARVRFPDVASCNLLFF